MAKGKQEGNSTFELSEQAKFLGLVVDNRLKWDKHIQDLNGKLASSCFMLKILARQCNLNTLKTVYYCHFQSRLNYGIIFWGGTARSISTFKVQKRAIRTMLALKKRASCRNAFKTLQILTMTSLYILETALFVRDNQQQFAQHAGNHRHNTRGAKRLVLQQHRLALSDNDPFMAGVRITNGLPQSIKDIKERGPFKKQLKSYLTDKVFYSMSEFEDNQM